MAYEQLGGVYQAIGETVRGVEVTRKAFELRGRMSELEKLGVEGDYYRVVTRNLIDARQSYALGEQIYPRDPYFQGGLGVTDYALGQYESALKEHQEVLRLLPYDSTAVRFVAYTYLLLERVEDAAATARKARVKGLDADLGPIVYAIAFYRNDASEMARQVAAAAGKTGEEDLLLALNADTAAYFGHLEKSRELSRRAADSAELAGGKETAATYNAVSALREALFGTQIEQGSKPFWRRDVRLGGTWITAWRWQWPMQGRRAKRKPWLMTWLRGFRRTRSYSSIVCPLFGQRLRSSVQTLNRRWTLLGPLLRMNLVCRRLAFTTGRTCIPSMCEEKPI